MSVASDDQVTSICGHCDRAIPSSNIDLHSAFCSRNLEKCKICGDMVPKKSAEEHYHSTHAPVSCSLCSETMDRNFLSVHKGESCPKRIVTCEYCEFPLPAVDLLEHQEVCGNRTELCNLCLKYIRLRERIGHDVRCTGINNVAEPSRNARAPENVPRQHPYYPRRFIFTIAITGIAVVLSTIIFQRKPEDGR